VHKSTRIAVHYCLGARSERKSNVILCGAPNCYPVIDHWNAPMFIL